MPPTLNDVMRASRSHTTGFDYLRIGLALAVLCVHVISIADHDRWLWLWHSWFAPIELAILPAFFVLSGFLVAGSLFRNSLPQFLALRVVRIVPALAVEIGLSALVLGVCVTTLTLRAYVASPELHAYFLNIVGYIHYTLPGVFGGRQINVQLWTIPFEFECYLCLVGLAVLGVVRRRSLLAGLLGLAILGMTAAALLVWHYHAGWNVPGRTLVLAFLGGVTLYLFKDRVPHSAALFWVCVVLSYGLLGVPDLVFLATVPLAYATVYVGLLRPRPVPFGDLSYGLYLFHYPIALALFELTGARMGWPLLLVATVGLSGLFASGSWRWVERPVLGHKRAVLAGVDRLTRRLGRAAPLAVQPDLP